MLLRNVLMPWDYLPRVSAYSVKLSACIFRTSAVKASVASYTPKFSLMLYTSNANTAYTTCEGAYSTNDSFSDSLQLLHVSMRNTKKSLPFPMRCSASPKLFSNSTKKSTVTFYAFFLSLSNCTSFTSRIARI